MGLENQKARLLSGQIAIINTSFVYNIISGQAMLRSTTPAFETLGDLPTGCWKAVASDASGQYLFAASALVCPTVAVKPKHKYKNVTSWPSSGSIYVSSNYGKHWAQTGPQGDRQDFVDIAVSVKGQNIVAIASNSRVLYSLNFGVSWTLSSNSPILSYSSVTSSNSGMKVIVAAPYTNANPASCEGFDFSTAGLWMSMDYGQNFTRDEAAPRVSWQSVACSRDCLVRLAVGVGIKTGGDDPDKCGDQGGIYVYRENWGDRKDATARGWRLSLPGDDTLWGRAVVSADGSRMCAAARAEVPGGAGGGIYCSDSGGERWSLTPAPLADWVSLAADPSGLIVYGVSRSGKGKTALHYSINGGSKWYKVTPVLPGGNDTASFQPTVMPSPAPALVDANTSTNSNTTSSNTGAYARRSLHAFSSHAPPFELLSLSIRGQSPAQQSPSSSATSSAAQLGGQVLLGAAPGGVYVFTNARVVRGREVLLANTLVALGVWALLLCCAMGSLYVVCLRNRRARRGSVADKRQMDRMPKSGSWLGVESKEGKVDENTRLLSGR